VAGVGVIGIVAVLGIEPPASHAGHEHGYGALPPDIAFVHIHSAEAMAEVTIAPGHTGVSQATIRLLSEDSAVLYGRTFSFQCDIDASNIRQIRIKRGRSWLNVRQDQEAKRVPRLEAAIRAKLTRG